MLSNDLSEMRETIEVRRLEETGFTIDQVFGLLKASFQQWLDHGIDSAVARYSLEDFKEKTEGHTVIVAYSGDRLLGTLTMELDRPPMCYGEFVAVTPGVKRCGIGAKLLEKQSAIAREKSCTYIVEDTSEKATWSVKWHLKQGYRKVGYASFRTNDYYSYVFRKQLVPSRLWDSAVWCKCVFLCRYCKTKMLVDRFGNPTALGRLLRHAK